MVMVGFMWRKNITIIRDYVKLVNMKDKHLFFFVLFNILTNAMELVIPFATAKIIESIAITQYNQAFRYVVILGISFILRNIFLYFNYANYARFFQNCYVTLHERIMNNIYSFDEEYSTKISSGKLVNTCNMDLINIAEIPSFIFSMGVQFLKIIIIIAIFFNQSILIGLYIILINFIYCYFSTLYNNKGAILLKRQRRYADKLTNLLSQVLLGMRDMKGFDLSNKLNNKFDVNRKKWAINYYEKRKCFFINQSVVVAIIQYGKIILYGILIILVIREEMTLAVLLMLISYYDKSWDTICSMMDSNMNILEESVSMYRIYDILRYCPGKYLTNKMVHQDSIIGTIEFKNVFFQYKKVPVLNNISFKIKENTRTCIVGPTGSGKTTIFNLLLRFYKVNKGSILLDNINIYDYSKDVYASNITIVHQKSFIFNMSIRENLSLIDSNRNHQINACKRVGIHDYIMSLPKGYNTILREDAINISGGQKQLLSIARALLTTSEILLLDEITSSLDPKTTELINHLLDDLKVDHTVILITHNKEMMKQSDKLIVLNKGKIVAQGSHEELIEKNKYYIDFFQEKE